LIKIIKKAFYQTFAYINLFCLFFSPIFKNFGIGAVSIFGIICLFPTLRALKRIEKKSLKKIQSALTWFLITGLFCQFLILVNTDNLLVLKYIISILVFIIPSIFLICFWAKNQKIDKIPEIVFNLGFLQGTIIIFASFWPDLDVKISEILITPPKTGVIRNSGFSSLAGDGLSFSLMITGLFGYFSINKTKNNFFLFLQIAKLAIILLSLFFVARIGLYLLIFALLFVILNMFLHNPKKTVILTSFLLLCFVVIYNTTSKNIFFSEKVKPYALELFLNYAQSRKLTSASTEDLFSMLKFPDTTKSWLIGFGKYSLPNNQGNFGGIDIGYLRFLLLFGILGSSAFYLYIFFLAKSTINYAKSSFDKKVIFLFFVCFFISQIKFPFFFTQACFASLSILYFWFLLNQQKQKNKT